MAEEFERVPRPSSIVESPGVSTNHGLSRHGLMLLLSTVALFAGLAGAAVSYYRFYAAEQQKLVNEALALQPEARAAQILNEYDKNPRSHPRLDAEIQKLYSDLNHEPPSGALSPYEAMAYSIFAKHFATPILERRKLSQDKREAEAATKNQEAETELHKKEAARAHQQTRTETQRANISEGVTTPALIKQLREAAEFSISGEPMGTGLPKTKKSPNGSPEPKYKIDQ